MTGDGVRGILCSLPVTTAIILSVSSASAVVYSSATERPMRSSNDLNSTGKNVTCW